jgi:hypothetical protein
MTDLVTLTEIINPHDEPKDSYSSPLQVLFRIYTVDGKQYKLEGFMPFLGKYVLKSIDDTYHFFASESAIRFQDILEREFNQQKKAYIEETKKLEHKE